jgi:zinc/manganese transport system substrate-binding protein
LLRGMAVVTTLGLAALLVGGCGSESSGQPAGPGSAIPVTETPTVVVTTSILGDVVSNLLGDHATVETIMPPGADPHDFQASAQQVNAMREAEVVITNGADFEQGLLDAIDAAERDGAHVCAAIDAVTTITFEAGAHDNDHNHDHSEVDGHGPQKGEDEVGAHTSTQQTVDPHFFTDPARMAVAAEGLTACIIEAVPALATEKVRATSAAHVTQITQLDLEVEAMLETVPQPRRVLITNHEVFGYFADRYGFEVAGTIIPSLSTQSEASAAHIAELAARIKVEGVPVVFADTSSSDQLAQALAGEAGEVKVVELFSESLGPDGGETYLKMVRTNAERITAALR